MEVQLKTKKIITRSITVLDKKVTFHNLSEISLFLKKKKIKGGRGGAQIRRKVTKTCRRQNVSAQKRLGTKTAVLKSHGPPFKCAVSTKIEFSPTQGLSAQQKIWSSIL